MIIAAVQAVSSCMLCLQRVPQDSFLAPSLIHVRVIVAYRLLPLLKAQHLLA
jgi:hypothetical protein